MRGFWWSHVGWILCDKYGATRYDEIKDFAKYPELRFLNKHDWIGPVVARRRVLPDRRMERARRRVLRIDGAAVAHDVPRQLARARVRPARLRDRRHEPELDARSRSITGGEGWHNNHHRYPSSARQGFRWWQIDTTYYGLRVLQALGIVHDLRQAAGAA